MKLLTLLLALAGCYLKHYPVTPEVADPSVYLAETAAGTGTAWVAAQGFLVTAGHVCEHAADGAPVWLHATSGWRVPAHPVVWEESLDPYKDACVLKADGPVGDPLILADAEPFPGMPDTVIGYPNRIHTVTHGFYQSDWESSAPVDHGNSGGPVFTARGVYMIVIQPRPGHLFEPEAGSAGTSVFEIRALLDSVDARYTLTPDELPCEAQPEGCDPTDDL